MSTDSALSTPWLVALIVGVWLVAFPLFWLGITGLLSTVGGWRELARSYARDPAAFRGVRRLNATGSMGRFLLMRVNYSHTLRVHVWRDGFGLSTMPLFRFMHPPLFIPWTAVRTCEERTLLFWPYVQIELHGSSINIMIGGRAGRAIREGWIGARPEPGVPAAMYG
ncbi:MAG TPA: hypothetical protein VGX50_12535 [Longimicrobium sp.]|jgi:hypothetical protein|nr:hypothetical protein [Longimicrobium sp.]